MSLLLPGTGRNVSPEKIIDQILERTEPRQRHPPLPLHRGRDQGPLEAELRRLLEPQRAVRHRPELARQRDLAERHRLGRDRPLGQRRDQGRRHREVGGGIAQPVAAGDVEIDFGGREAETAARLEHGEDHREAARIPADHGAARRGAAGEADGQRLDLDQDRAGCLRAPGRRPRRRPPRRGG